MHPVYKLDGSRFVIGGQRLDRFFCDQLEAEYQAQPTNGADNLRIRRSQPLQLILKPSAEFPRVLCEPCALDNVEDTQRYGTAQRRSAERGAMRPRAKKARVLFAHPDRADGESTPQRLGHGDGIRQERLMTGDVFENALETLETAGAEVAALDAVHEEQEILLVAQLAQAQQIFRQGWSNTAFTLDAFDENGGRCR